MKLRLLAHWLAVVVRFAAGGGGDEYDVGPFRRLRIALRMLRNYVAARKLSGTTLAEQIALVDAVLRIPRSSSGVICEFGCYKGIASSALSIAAHVTGRKLIVFDSFAGLPEDGQPIRSIVDGQTLEYSAGGWAGTLEEVRGHVVQYGEPSVVEFVPGFFNKTLPHRPATERYCFCFEDADLISSVKDVLRAAWPRMVEGAPFFCHEARDREVVQLFFDEAFWRQHFNEGPPGLVGSGVGLPLNPGGGYPPLNGVTPDLGSCLGVTWRRQGTLPSNE